MPNFCFVTVDNGNAREGAVVECRDQAEAVQTLWRFAGELLTLDPTISDDLSVELATEDGLVALHDLDIRQRSARTRGLAGDEVVVRWSHWRGKRSRRSGNGQQSRRGS